MLNKSDVRYTIASVVGAQISSFECKNSCKTIIRIQTGSAEESVKLIDTIKLFIEDLKYFQAYDVDDFATDGSICYLGGNLTLGSYAMLYLLTSYPSLKIM